MPEQSAGADNSVEEGRDRHTAALARGYLEAMRAADTAGAYRLAAQALEEGMSLVVLYQRVITEAMYELGRLWEKGVITIADEHMATAVTHRVLAALRPEHLRGTAEAAEGVRRPRAMLAAVEGEQHALGLRMVADVLEDAGYQAVYLGADVPTEALLQGIESLSPDLLGLSATMPASGQVLLHAVASIRGSHPRLEVLVGGQAGASSRVEEATPIADLAGLEERVRSA